MNFWCLEMLDGPDSLGLVSWKPVVIYVVIQTTWGALLEVLKWFSF